MCAARFLEWLPAAAACHDMGRPSETVKLTMTESYPWDVPEALLSGGRSGWPAILSSLKSTLETGKPLVVKLEPPKQMMEVVKELVATKPWLRRERNRRRLPLTRAKASILKFPKPVRRFCGDGR